MVLHPGSPGFWLFYVIDRPDCPLNSGDFATAILSKVQNFNLNFRKFI